MIKVHVLRTGEVRVSPYLPFGGDHCSALKASGITTPKSKWIWLPVFSYYIETPKAKVLFDTGWNRDMSPEGVYDKKAQIRSLGSRILYNVNQGRIAKGEAVNEQLEAMGVKPSDLDYVLLSHLDCDHANGLNQVKDAKHILVSRTEMEGAQAKDIMSRVRFQKKWWEGVDLKTFEWNGTDGPVGHSYDVLGDGTLKMINIPGHSRGLCALKITQPMEQREPSQNSFGLGRVATEVGEANPEGKYVLLFADGGYATKSWKGMITSGIALDKAQQKKSLQWIREQAMNPNCVEALASHDTGVKPHVIEF